MALQDPVAVYNAATNLNAHLLKLRLVAAGVEAFVSEDFSTVGLWLFGTLPEIHKPQVWVSKSDVERARPILVQHEDESAERHRATGQSASDAGPAIEVVCDECQTKSIFPASQRGTIQDCPACGEYLDVGEIDEQDPYWLASDEEAEQDEA